MPYIPQAICVKCRTPFKPEKNEVAAHVYSEKGYYYSIWADLWKCPKCGAEIIIGFGKNPFIHNYQTDQKQPELKHPTREFQVNL